MPTLVSVGQITILDSMDGLNARLTNAAHVVPTGADGSSGDFTGCATTISVWLGASDETAQWSVIAVPSGGVTGALVGYTYTVTGMSTNTGYVDFQVSRSGFSSQYARFNITKAKQGGAGAVGPTVSVTADRATSFNALDGTLVAGQANIVFTATALNIASPTYVWTFSGFQTAPSTFTISTQTITAAQFGTSTSATVTCTVNGTYVDKITIVRLEKSSAAAGATLGADWATNLANKPANSDLLNVEATFQADRLWNFTNSQEGWTWDGMSDVAAGASFFTLTSGGTDPVFMSPAFSLIGATFTKVRARIRRTSGAATSWDGNCFFSGTGTPGYTDTKYKKVSPNPCVNLNEWVVVEWDMANLTAGGTAWTGTGVTISSIRLDFGASSGDTYDVDWVAIGNMAPGPGRISPQNIDSWFTSAAIGAAYIGQLTAANLTVAAISQTVNGGLVSGTARVEITSNTISIYASNNGVRVRLAA